ncbi:response regulator transcription factor [bacterium]|nr:response regulator transcription factor [bacterium]
MIKILIADDHAIFRNGLKSLINQEADMELIGEASNGREALELCTEFNPNIVIMDITMKEMNGIDATRAILSRNHEINVIALSTYTDEVFILEMYKAGVVAYLPKSDTFDELVKAIHEVQAGNFYLSPRLSKKIIKNLVNLWDGNIVDGTSILTHREREIVQLISEGKMTKEIATILNIDETTVNTHRKNIMKKLHIHNIAGLVKYAIIHNLTPIDK